MTPDAVIQETTTRFAERAAQRHDIQARLKSGSPLSADTPARVRKRITHLATSAMARAVTGGADGLPADRQSRPAGTVVEAPAAATATALERILDANNLMSVTFLEVAVQVARTVGRVQIRSAAGQLRGFGTGFMVAPRLLLTNNHVLPNATEARFARIEFNFQDGTGGSTPVPLAFLFDPDAWFATDPTLDYSIVAVRDNADASLSSFGFNHLIEEEGKVLVGEALNIIQHPNGEPKQLALRENTLLDVLPQFLHYHTDTAPGSSGSPVFNDQWEVVGLHHSGVPKRDGQGRILALDGQVWTAAMGEHRIAWVANEGARISQVLAHVRNLTGLSSSARMLRDSVFSAESALGSTASADRMPTVPVAVDATAPALADDGAAVWTIPLQVSVRLGDGGRSARQAAVPTAATIPPSPTRLASVPGLDEALEEARQARSRSYYDRAADQAAADAYYGDIDAAVDGARLFRELNALLSATHAPQPSYKPALHVYPFVDLHPDLKVRSIYSQRSFDAEELIREDFRILEERASRLQERVLAESTLSADRIAQEAEQLEADLPFNCEHVVPQSWFRKQEPMRGDLHHLFACEVGCNSFRGNKPYFDFPDFEEAIRDECGKSEAHRFEPGAGKGIVARATLYFLLRYPGQVNREMRTYDGDRLATLVSWHASHPVSDYERHRNLAIAGKQGNRNPLIDRPEWASRLDFRDGL